MVLLKTKQKKEIKPNIQRFDASLWGAIEPNKSIQGVSISWNEISSFITKLIMVVTSFQLSWL